MPQIRELLEPFARLDPRLLVELDTAREAVVRMQGHLSDPVDPAKLANAPIAAAREMVRKNKALFGDIDEKTSLADGRTKTDAGGMTHVVLQQKHGDATVLGAQISVHFKPDGTLYLLNSSLVRRIDAAGAPRLTPEQARQAAVKHAGADAKPVADLPPQLVVATGEYLHVPGAGKNTYLCWQVDVDQPRPRKPAAWVYFVDATNGQVLFRYSSLIAGAGQGFHSSYGPLPTEAVGTDFTAVDDQTSAAWATHTQVLTKDWTSGQLARDDNDNWGEAEATEQHERMEVDIHRYLGYAISYFHETHGHDSWDDGGGADVIAYAHYADPDNAFWSSNSHTIRVGDGNQDPAGSGANNPFGSLDMILHEFSHGVNHHFNVVQTYSGETGALNEAIADSLASLASLNHPADDSQPWVIGERVCVTAHPRSLADPSRDAGGVVRYIATDETTKYNSVRQGFYPDHYSICYRGTNDFNGVHCNAPIIGHAIYLMVTGGTHRLSGMTVAGIGPAPVERMLYYAISTPGLLTNTSVFGDFRRAMLSACQILFPNNLDYLMTVKGAFKGVGVGPDLFVRDYPGDTGQEPAATLSCWSPDIINRTSHADATLLAQMADLTNSSLCQNLERGQDNYVYFRILNGGSATAGGMFRLYLSPVSTFPNPASWNLIGAWPFPPVPVGGFWTPAAPAECLVVPAALTNTLGTIHCCFIGVIDAPDDPAPDHNQIDSVAEFHDFIRDSNNFAWRNCDIVDAVTDPVNPVVIHGEFMLNGIGRRAMPIDFEVDTTNLPDGGVVQVLLPKTKGTYLNFNDVRPLTPLPERVRIAALPVAIPAKLQQPVARPPADFAVPTERLLFVRGMLDHVDIAKMRVLAVKAGRITRITGIHLDGKEALKVNFVAQLPPGGGARDVFLAFRQVWRNEPIGQMNYDIHIRRKR